MMMKPLGLLAKRVKRVRTMGTFITPGAGYGLYVWGRP